MVAVTAGDAPVPAPARATLHRLDSLTGLRFFAAYMVVQHHFTNFGLIPGLARYTGFGASGVSFFFVLSGFVLTWSYVPTDTPGRFYWRRFARIWPLHVVTTLIAVPVFYTGRDLPVEWGPVILSIFLLHAWSVVPTTYFAGNPASWSLSCEIFFYALHPFVVRRALALRAMGLVVATALLLVTLALVADQARAGQGLHLSARVAGWLLYISPLFRVGEFLLGIALASALKRGYRLPVRFWPSVVLVGLWFEIIYDISPHHLPVWLQITLADVDYAVLPVLYACVIASAAQLDLREARSWLRARPMVLLGQWSYALYLIHASVVYGFIHVFGRHATSVTNVAWLLVVSAVSVAASAGLYYAIEHPIEDYLRGLQRAWIAARAKRSAAEAT